MPDMLLRIDRRLIYVVLMVIVLVPLVKPLGQPITISAWTRNVYDEISKLQPGDKALISLDMSTGSAPDVLPQAEAVFQHLMSKNVKVVGTAFSDQAVMFWVSIISQWENKGKVYGEDFCCLGYIPGGETGLAAFAADFKKVAPQDFRGNQTASLPIMQDVNTMNDIKFAMDYSGGGGAEPAAWVRQVVTKYKVPLSSGIITVMGPYHETYVQAGQLKGILVGLRGAAEYRLLINSPGRAVASMDAQSLGHMTIIAFIVLGNLGYFLSRGKAIRGGGASR